MRLLVMLAFLGACMGDRTVEDEPADPARVVAPVDPVAPAPASIEAAPEADPAPVVADPIPAPIPAPVRVAPAPAALATAPGSIWRCEVDADCVIECDLPGECCGAPCGCRTAVNRHVLAEIRTQPWVKCTREQHRRECPAVACAYEPATHARCTEGRCRASDLRDL